MRPIIRTTRQGAIDIILSDYNYQGIFDTVTLEAMSNRKLSKILDFEMEELDKPDHWIIKDFMIINLRLKNGWEKTKQYGGQFCDKCKASLYEAPHGGLYCDRVHEPTIGTGE